MSTYSSVEHFNLNTASFDKMADFFYTNGFIILDDALSPDVIARLREDLAKADSEEWENRFKENAGRVRRHQKENRHIVHKRFFEKSSTVVDIIENSALMSFAEYLVKDVPNTFPDNPSLKTHVIHNNAFIVPPKGRGQAPSWHVDDPLQQVIVPRNTTLPNNIRLPFLAGTFMIWLSDCTTPENGPTFVVPQSHRFGSLIDKAYADKNGIPACGKAGTAVLINCNVWHRGAENKSNVARETLQISVGRRMIGHKHGSIMDYQMPSHVYKDRDEKFNQRLKERLGYLEGGAYS